MRPAGVHYMPPDETATRPVPLCTLDSGALSYTYRHDSFTTSPALVTCQSRVEWMHA